MILRPGEKIHVVHRRLFENDARRHFVGVVESYAKGEVRVMGHMFVLGGRANKLFQRKPDLRSRIFSVLAGAVFVNVLPEEVNLEGVVYEFHDNALRVTDGSGWHMDLKEFGWG